MRRIFALNRDLMSEEMRREWDLLSAWRPATKGMFGGPYDPWLQSPELCHRLQGFVGFLWERTSLARGLVEFAITLTSAHWGCNIEWLYHRTRAIEHGVAPAMLDALLAADAPPPQHRDFRIAYSVLTALLGGKALSEKLYREAVDQFGERGLVEITAVAGYYSLVAFTLRAFEIEPDPDVERPFLRPADFMGMGGD